MVLCHPRHQNKVRALSILAVSVFFVLAGSPVRAGEADVIAVRADKGADGVYRFAVTVRHADAGWDHYADRWEIVSTGGQVIATRFLLHPHTREQPFTRSLGGVKIPTGMTSVRVRAHDKVHGFGGREAVVQLAE